MPIPLVKVPRYQMTLPLSGEVVDYRPFLVKEEKLLVMAKDSGDKGLIIRTVGDIVRDCTDGKVDSKVASMFDVQYAFLALRGKSVGEEIEYFLVCGKCGFKTTSLTRSDEFKLIQTAGHSNIVVVDESIRLTMKYPTFEHFLKLFGETESGEPDIDGVVEECVDTMVTEEEVIKITKDNIWDLGKFIGSMLPAQYDRLEKFFETMPVFQCSKEYQCERCGTNNIVNIGGVNNFFV